VTLIGEKVGAKIKSLRNARKITLKALGLATGLSVSYLSQVERGISSVNVNSLRKIADALETTIDYFLEPPALHEKSVMRLHEQDVFTVDGSRFYYSRISNDTLNGRLLEPIVVSILPSDERERIEPACHAGEEFIYVLEGILTLFFNGEKILMYPGDSAHYDGAVPHEWGNFTAKMVRILAVNTPALFREK
jgi:Uncharacterized conserved protein, contains double-stranded beta-helix domain